MAESDSSPASAKTLHVAIVAWQALPAIMPEVGRNVGGLETAAWRLAKALAGQQTIHPQMIVRSPHSAVAASIEGVQITAHIDPREYVRREVAECIGSGEGAGIRFSPKLLWQIPYLAMTWPWRAKDPIPMKPDPRLVKHLPDVWIAWGSSRESAGVVATAIEQHKPSLLMIQSNADLDERYVRDPEFRSAYGEIAAHCRFAIENATRIVCQTRTQQKLLRQHFGRDGILMRNVIDPAAWREATKKGGDYVLWIGRYDRFHKRPHLALEIATRCPEIPFRMIVNETDDEVRREIQASCPKNVQLVDYIPSNEMPSEFAAARIFLSTGNAQYEGFPTVLLQAVAAEKPIVSIDDFDEFIAESRSGVVCGDDPQRAAEAITRFWNQPQEHDATHATSYLEKHHSVESTTNLFVEILGSLLHPSAAANAQ